MHTTFKCGPCDKQFQTKQKLKKHLRLHTSLNGVRYKCEHCEEELNSKYELSIHVRNHTEFKCGTCKNFFTKRGLKWHKKVCSIPTTTEANKQVKLNSKAGDFQWIADYFWPSCFNNSIRVNSKRHQSLAFYEQSVQSWSIHYTIRKQNVPDFVSSQIMWVVQSEGFLYKFRYTLCKAEADLFWNLRINRLDIQTKTWRSQSKVFQPS